MSFFLSGFPIPDTQDIGDSLPYINKSLFNLDVAVALLSAGGREFATLTSLIIPTDGSTSYFLTNYVNSIPDNYIVYLDGVKQLPYIDYTINAATSSIVFPSPAPDSGIVLEVIRAVAVVSYTDDVTKLPLVGGTLTGSLSAPVYYGDGSKLTGIVTKDKLPLTGGTLSGPLIGVNATFLNEGDLVSTASSRVWRDIATSYDGTIQVAVAAPNDRIYVSRNSGSTWVAKQTNRSWSGIAISHDGAIQTAVTSNSSIFISFDYGDNWDESETIRPWKDIAMSSNGQYQTAATGNSQIIPGGGQIYVTSDYGSSWTPRITDANRSWAGIAMSYDGSKQTAIANQGQIYVSRDYGNTWTPKDQTRNWVGIAMSSDGTIQTAVVEGGQIYISTDSGETWIAKDQNRNWKNVAMSFDGARQVAIVADLGGSTDSFIYVSTDSGNTWTARMADEPRPWYAVAMSPDGTKITAGLYNGPLYINKSPLELKSGALFADSATLYTNLSTPNINTRTVQLTGAVFTDTGSLRLRYGNLTLDGSYINNPYGNISTGSITFANGLYSLNSTGLVTARAGLFVQELTASSFIGDGSRLTGLNVSNRLALSGGTLTGGLSAPALSGIHFGDGSRLTGIKYSSFVETIIATANQTTFTLNSITYAPNTNNLSVYSNGLRLISGNDYNETSSNVVTLTQGVPLGTELVFEAGRINTQPIGTLGDIGTFTSYVSAPTVRGTFVGDGSRLTGIAAGGTANALPLSGGTLTGGLLGTTAGFTGNVGIGTVNPNEKLTVVGNISATGAVQASIATFSTSISAPALSGTFFGDGSKLTGIVGGGGGTANALPLSGGTLTGTLSGTTATFSTSISAPALSGTFYGDGSRLTGTGTPSVYGNKTGTYTIASSDINSAISFNSSSVCYLQIPSDATNIPIGSQFTVIQEGLGNVIIQIVPSSGVSLQSYGSRYTTTGQYAMATLMKVASNTWRLAGTLS